MDINITNSYTEISALGGGNFITEAYPTNFHHFYSRKALTPKERVEDFMEVTAAKRNAIELTDAAWVRPPQWVIDEFNADPNGCFNEDTGFGELNGLKDLSPQDMTDIVIYGRRIIGIRDYYVGDLSPKIRTNLTPVTACFSINSGSSLFAGQSKIEHINLVSWRFGEVSWRHVRPEAAWMSSTFLNCKSLRIISGVLDLSLVTGTENVFKGCNELREVRIKSLKTNIGIPDSALISLESVTYLVANAINKSAITVTVHPEVYEKLTDEGNAEWHKVMTDAAAKNISFVRP